MDTIRKTLAVLIAVLLFPVIFLPDPVSPYFIIVKIFLFLAVLIGLFLAAFPGIKLKNIGFLLSRSSPETVNDAIQTEVGLHYDGLVDLISKTIQSINTNYQSAIFILSPGKHAFTLQKSSGSIFKSEVQENNEILQSIRTSSSGIVIQKKDAGDAWVSLLNEKPWRGSETLIGSAIFFRNIPVGCILVYTEHFSEYHEKDSQIILSLSKLFSDGMDQIEKIEKLSMDSYFFERIAQMVSSIDIRPDDDHLWDGINNLCRSLFSYDKLTLSVLEKDSNEATVKLVDGMTDDMNAGKTFNIQTTLHGRPIREATTINSSYWENDYQDSGRFKPGDSNDFHFMSILAVPIKINGETRGSLALEQLSTKGFSKTDQHLLEFFAINLEGILSWIEEYQELHQSAIHDGLTKLLNHAAFKDQFEVEISRASRFNQHMTLVMLDLDKFKRVNDSYGHLYGDYVLKTVSDLIKKSVRTIDIVGRYGGEEFAILLINTDKHSALPVSKRIVDSIGDYAFSKDGIETTLTISAGMSEFPTDADQIKDLIEKADRAMYETKAKGGNGVTIFGGSSDGIPSFPSKDRDKNKDDETNVE